MPSTRDLDERFRDEAQDLIDFAKSVDPAFTITSSRRSRAEQQRLWNRYTSGQSDLPAAPPGASQHELGLAVDIARPGVNPRDDDLLYALGQAWEDAGGKWAGDVDPVHFEWSGEVLSADEKRQNTMEWARSTPVGQDLMSVGRWVLGSLGI